MGSGLVRGPVPVRRSSEDSRRRRVDLAAILGDPVRRHRLLVAAGIALQAREGRDVGAVDAAAARLRVLPRRERDELLQLLPPDEREQLERLLKGESCPDS